MSSDEDIVLQASITITSEDIQSDTPTPPTSNNTLNENVNKFTKGEKCLFVNIILTFICILILTLIYIIHLFVVKHKGFDVFSVRRRHGGGDYERSDTEITSVSNIVGVVYLNSSTPLVLCNTVLLKPHWSLAPGHCVTVRNDPDMTYALVLWTVVYRNNRLQESLIKRAIVHPYFDINNYSNNVGIFEHFSAIISEYFLESNYQTYNLNDVETYKVTSMALHVDFENKDASFVSNIMDIPAKNDCKHLLSSMKEIDQSEFCGIIGFDENKLTCEIRNGVSIFSDNKFIGLSSWGDKCEEYDMPLVFTNIFYYLEWIQDITSLSVI